MACFRYIIVNILWCKGDDDNDNSININNMQLYAIRRQAVLVLLGTACHMSHDEPTSRNSMQIAAQFVLHKYELLCI